MNPRTPARETLHVSTPDERTIVVERGFDASRPKVWDAWTKPELLRRWLCGSDGWILDVCDVDLRPGGAFRWVWKRAQDGTSMGLSGVYREVQAPARLVNTEEFDERWYPGDALITLELSESDGRTHARSTWRYDSTEARDIVLRTAISGVEMSYDRLAEVLTAASEPALMQNRTTVERKSERELLVTRVVKGPPRLVFEAWTKAELFQRWWVPKSLGLSLLSCAMDVRVGGTYRLVFRFQGSEMAFFGTYREVTPYSRLVWTNEESGDVGQVTTVTFEERGGKTLVVLHELYPSKEALDEGIGSVDAMPETFEQLDELLATLTAGAGSW